MNNALSDGSVSFAQTDLTGGFFADRQRLNRDGTVFAVRDRFRDTGRFEAFKFNWREGMENKPHIFWDSDIAKWIESAAYILEKENVPSLRECIEGVIDLIEKNRCDDGYFNIYFSVCEPGKRFTVRDAHELYCAGHLTEAAIAYDNAVGDDRFLKIMEDYIALIEKAFVTEKTAEFSTPGHEELELALVKLWRHTGNARYLSLARSFLDARGCSDNEICSDYNQSHLPVREQFTAEGHCVRACYLYSAMADLALADGDEKMLTACRKLFENITDRRMYITGGIGSTRNGERFTKDWHLPNASAYAETCAAISLCMFAKRMSLIEPDGRYADAFERALYNGVISGISLDGRSFFYENPLEIDMYARSCELMENSKKRYPITQRVEVFDCSCCPPNVTRFIASLGDCIYSYKENTVFIHQYLANNACFDADGQAVKIQLETDYPVSGSVKIKVESFNGTLAVRIPAVCAEQNVKLNGTAFSGEPERGYVYIPVTDGDVIQLELSVKPFLVTANSRVGDDAGRCAVMRGPVVYCLEERDNVQLDALSLRLPDQLRETDGFSGMPDIIAGGVRDDDSFLYRRLSDTSAREECELRFIPYYAFANRGESDMRVWVPFTF